MANSRRFFNIAHEVKSILQTEDFHIFCLTETFINQNEKNNFYTFPGYDMIRNDRPEKAGGGLLC